jgi:hypothetical protein
MYSTFHPIQTVARVRCEHLIGYSAQTAICLSLTRVAA